VCKSCPGCGTPDTVIGDSFPTVLERPLLTVPCVEISSTVHKDIWEVNARSGKLEESVIKAARYRILYGKVRHYSVQTKTSGP